MAEANSRQEIFVSWLCPEFINTHHEALLRYQILYHEGQEFMSGSAIPVDGLKPLLLNGSLSTNCVVEALVPNLSLGTRYVVKVVAMTSGTEGESAREYAVVTTFGSCELRGEGGRAKRRTGRGETDNPTSKTYNCVTPYCPILHVLFLGERSSSVGERSLGCVVVVV